MESNIKVSVVIPVYNVEKYLEKCLDTIINQTLKEIEIICVNDGSTDNSINILKKYGIKDNRIQIVSQENKGSSAGRNTGIEHSNGEYIIFIDSDDWIELNTLEELYNYANQLNLDILMFKLVFFNQDTLEKSQNQFSSFEVINSSFDGKVFNYKDVLDVLFKISHSPFKLHKASFLKDNDIKFIEGLNYEDVVFFFQTFLNAKRISILRRPFYYYRTRDDSTSNVANEGSFDIFKILKITQDFLKEKNIYNSCINDFTLFTIVNIKYVYLRLDEKYKKEYLSRIHENYKVFNLDKVNSESLEKWHFDDKVFYEAISKSSNEVEFELNYKKSYYEFLANHYKQLSKNYEKENEKLKEINNQLKSSINKNSKKSFKNFFKW